MKKYLLITFLTAGFWIDAVSQNYSWVSFITPANSTSFVNEPTDMCTDAEGNIYVLGKYSEDISNGKDILKIQATDKSSVYLAKYSKNGKPIWIIGMGGTWYDTPKYIKYVDGSLYVMGFFQTDLIYIGTKTITKDKNNNYLLKFSTDGEYLSHTSLPGLHTYYTEMTSIGNLLYLLAGKSIVILDTNFELQNTYTFSSKQFISLKDIVAVDKENLVVCGNFNNGYTVTYQDTTINDKLLKGKGYPAFIASIKTDGSLNWIQAFGKTYDNYPMLLDVNHKAQTIYFSGMYNTEFTWQKNVFTSNLDIGTNTFLASLSFNGSINYHQSFLPHTTNAAKNVIANDIIAQEKGIYIVGYANSAIVSNDKVILDIKAGFGNGYILNLDEEGISLWSSKNGTSSGSNEVITGLATNNGGYFAALSASGKDLEYGCMEYDTLPGTAIMHINNNAPSEGPEGELSILTTNNIVSVEALLDSYDTLYWTINGKPVDTNNSSIQIEPTKSESFTICMYAVNDCGVLEMCEDYNFTYKQFIQLHQAMLSSGGDLKTDNGSVSYSLGQVFFHQVKGDNMSLAEGVQQPYGVTIKTTVPDAPKITLETSVYPNPTNEYLYLTINGAETDVYTIRVFDLKGVNVFQQETTGYSTSFSLQHLAAGSYLLQLSHKTSFIKSFTIIKN